MLIVKKFGGTSVGDKERMYNVANRCIEEYKKGNDVVVVLSAMGKYTDELIRMAHDMDDKPPKREMDMLLTIGEQMSVSLMAMVMHKLGVPAVSLNAFQVTMHTTSSHQNARLKRIDTERMPAGLSSLPDSREWISMMITPLWDEAVLIPLPWHWQQRFMQMPARFIQMWTAFTQPTHVRFQMQES